MILKKNLRMNQEEEEERIEDLLKRFMYNVKREKLHHLEFDTLKTLLLRKITDEWIDLLNLMSRGDVYQLSFEEIFETCKRISRGMERVSKSTSTLVRQDELGNSLDKFKTEILSNLSEQVEMLRMKNYQKEDAGIFVIHEKLYATKFCSSFPKFKEVYQEDNGARQSPKKLCYVAPKRPWQPSQLDMMQ